MRIFINGRPSFYLASFLSSSSQHPVFFPLNQDRCYSFYSCRYALAAGIIALGIAPEDIVLLPAYNCSVEIDPILSSGIRIAFYNVKRDLNVDLDDLLMRIHGNVRAILVTHFLGFPQPIERIREICLEKNIFLIEDCAHALLSLANGKHLGSYGDIAIFSLLKSLPVPNGGLLLLNNKDVTCAQPSQTPSSMATFLYLCELLRFSTTRDIHVFKEALSRIFALSVSAVAFYLRLFLVILRKIFGHTGLYLVRPDSYNFLSEILSWKMSPLSERLLKRVDFQTIKDTRRRNYLYLLDHFSTNDSGILPFKELPTGVSPLFFPIILESPKLRQSLYNSLKSAGVVTHPWWDRFHPGVPWEKFPDAVYLKRNLFGLPIHQDLTLKHLDRIIAEFHYHKSNQSR